MSISLCSVQTTITEVMASISTAAAADGLRTAQHAREAAYLLQSLDQSPELAAVQRIRTRDLEENLYDAAERRKLHSKETAACSYCGTLLIPGWTGSMRLSSLRPGKRNRKQSDVTSNRRNRLEWTCTSCERTLRQTGSDPYTKAKFGPVKKHAPLSVLLEHRVIRASRSAMLDAGRVKQELPPAVQDKLQPPPAAGAGAATDKHVPLQPPAKTPKMSASPSPNPAPPKKKRTKREGLQAMLQAKREQEEQAKQAAGSLGLSSFLKGLQ